MKKRIFLVFLATLGLLYAQEHKFSTDIKINKILKASINQMNFILCKSIAIPKFNRLMMHLLDPMCNEPRQWRLYQIQTYHYL